MKGHIGNVSVYHSNAESILHLDLEYPKSSQFDTLSVNVTSVRAVDGIRVKFDFDRDGWVITQPRVWYTKSPDEPNFYDRHEEWIEAAFCPAWQFELTKSEGEKIVFNEEENE